MESAIWDCSICWYKFNEHSRKPLCLPCGHVFCQDCIFKLAQQDSKNGEFQTNAGSNSEKLVVCPSDKITHKVVIPSLPICFQIIQFMPKTNESKEHSTGLFHRMQTAETEGSQNNEDIRAEFKSVFKQATEEYKRSRLWDETIKQVSSSKAL